MPLAAPDLAQHLENLFSLQDHLSQADTIDSFPELRSDLGRLARGLYLCELTERFAVEDAPAAGMFRMLVDALEWLGKAESPDLLLRWYEMRTLHLNGFQPEVQRCADCGQELAPEPHTFSPARGGIVCPSCRPAGTDQLLPASVATVKLLRYLRRADPGALGRLRVGDDERRQVEHILRTHLQFVLDRKLRSTSFLDEVRKWPEVGRTARRGES